MKFFIDTGDTAEIKLANDMGIIDGVTTNPSLVAKAGKPFHVYFQISRPVRASMASTVFGSVM